MWFMFLFLFGLAFAAGGSDPVSRPTEHGSEISGLRARITKLEASQTCPAATPELVEAAKAKSAGTRTHCEEALLLGADLDRLEVDFNKSQTCPAATPELVEAAKAKSAGTRSPCDELLIVSARLGDVENKAASATHFVRAGVFLGFAPGAWTLPGEVIGPNAVTIFGYEGQVGGYVGYGGNAEGRFYVGGEFIFARGAAHSQTLGGNVCLGAAVSERTILCGTAGALVRDSGLEHQAFLAKYTAGTVGVRTIWKIVPIDVFDVRAAVDGYGAFGLTTQPVTGEARMALEVGARISVQVGINGPR